MLLKKLVEIQAGKRVSHMQQQSTLPKSQSFVTLIDNRAKSLHISKRKQELERIEKENLKIAQKIYQLKPYLEFDHLEDEFQQHQKYSDNIRKLRKRKVPKHAGRLGQLPPIDSEDNLYYANRQTNSNRQGIVSQSMVIQSSKGIASEEDKTHHTIDLSKEVISPRDDQKQQDSGDKAHHSKVGSDGQDDRISKRPGERPFGKKKMSKDKSSKINTNSVNSSQNSPYGLKMTNKTDIVKQKGSKSLSKSKKQNNDLDIKEQVESNEEIVQNEESGEKEESPYKEETELAD